MDPFEFAVTIPAGSDYGAMIRDVVAHGARQAGSDDGAALAFGCRAEDAVRDRLDGAGGQPLNVTVRIDKGPLQVLITGSGTASTLTLGA
jgi:hypothetical protein